MASEGVPITAERDAPPRPSSTPRPRIGDASNGGAGESELRDAVTRTRSIVAAGLFFWVLGGVSDLFVGGSGQAPLGWLLSIRVVYGLVVLGIWLRLRRAPMPSDRAFDLLCRTIYVGAAFALGWCAVLWRGLESPAGHGVSAVLCVQALGRPSVILPNATFVA